MAFETIGVRAVIEGLAAFERASRVIKKELVDIIDKEKELERKNEQLRKGLRNIGLAFVGVAAAGGAFLFTATRLAARVETLGVVTKQLGKNVGLTEKEVRALEKSIKAQGITLQATRKSIALMVQANIDLAKGTELARLAQDAAVIANINSSEAFERLVFVISSGNLRMARTLGLQVSFQQAYKDTAEAVGKAVSELTQQEKVQARTNVILEAGTRIAGTYAAAMETAGKKVLSLDRHLEESRRILGEQFLPIFADVVDAVTGGLKAFQNLDSATQKQIATGIAMATVWSGVVGTLALVASAVMKLRAALAAQQLTWIATLGPIGLFLGFLAAVTTAIVLQNVKLKENRRQFDLLEKEARGLSTTYEGYVKKVEALAEAEGKIIKTEEELNRLQPALRKAFLASGDVIELLSEKTFDAKTIYERYTDAIFEAAEKTDILIVSQEKLDKLTGRARSRLLAFNNVVIQLTEAQLLAKLRGEFQAESILKVADAFDKAAQEGDDLVETEEELAAATEALELEQERLNDELTKLKDLMKEDITKGFVEWRTKALELTATIEELEKKRYLTDEQKTELAETRAQLKETTAAWREHTANVIFSLAEQAAALGGLTDDEIRFLEKLQVELGLVDVGYFVVKRAVEDFTTAIQDSDTPINDAIENILALQIQLSNAALSGVGLQRAIDALTSKTVTVTTEFIDIRTGRTGTAGSAGGTHETTSTTETETTTTTKTKTTTGGGAQQFQRGGFARAGRAAIIGEGGMELFIPRTSGTILSNQFVNALGNLAHALTALPAMSAPMPMMAPAIAGSTQTNHFNMNIQTSAPREPIISDFATLEGLANAL